MKHAAQVLQTNPKQAVADYKQVLAMRPDWAEAWFDLGASEYQAHNYPEACPAFRRSSELAPKNGTVWAFLGLCESESGKKAEALADIRKGEALGIADNLAFVSSVRNRAAAIYRSQGDFSGAMEQLAPLARLGDPSPATVASFGVTALGVAASPVPPEQQALVELAGKAEWAFAGQHADEATKLFQQLVSEYPNQPGVHYMYGLYLLSDNAAAAQAQFQQELRLAPGNVPAKLQLAILHIKAGNPQQALPLAREVVRLQPASALAHVVLARCLLDTKQLAQALPELQTAAKLAPENPQTHFLLEEVYRGLGQSEDAKRERVEFNRLRAQQEANTYRNGSATAPAQ